MTSLVLSHVSNGMLNFAPTYLYVPSITSVLPFVPSELVELFSSSFVFAVSNTPIIPNMPITIIKNPKHIPIIIAFTFNDRKLNAISEISVVLYNIIEIAIITKFTNGPAKAIMAFFSASILPFFIFLL